MTTVLDTHALMAFLNAEPGAEAVRQLLFEANQASAPLLMCSVNVGELYYTTQRKHGRRKLPELDATLASLPIEMISADVPLAKVAAGFKATKKMSYADCFSAALAKVRDAQVVTGDPEFKQVEDDVKVLWI